jgi:hypothetical protein
MMARSSDDGGGAVSYLSPSFPALVRVGFPVFSLSLSLSLAFA